MMNNIKRSASIAEKVKASVIVAQPLITRVLNVRPKVNKKDRYRNVLCAVFLNVYVFMRKKFHYKNKAYPC